MKLLSVFILAILFDFNASASSCTDQPDCFQMASCEGFVACLYKNHSALSLKVVDNIDRANFDAVKTCKEERAKLEDVMESNSVFECHQREDGSGVDLGN